jgi:hypothetical protein
MRSRRKLLNLRSTHLVLGVENCERSVLLERCRVIAELVEQDSERPDICRSSSRSALPSPLPQAHSRHTNLLVVTLPPPDIDELGRPVLKRRRFVDLEFELLYLVDSRRNVLPAERSRRAPEIAQLVRLRRREEDVLNFEIAMNERRGLVVHVRDGLGCAVKSQLESARTQKGAATHLDSIAENFEDLALGQAVLKPGVHHVDDSSACDHQRVSSSLLS